VFVCLQANKAAPRRKHNMQDPLLSTLLRLGIPNGFFTSCSSTNSPYAFLLYPMRATCKNAIK
jgi:hypothetical protein